ncbi:MAG: D-glycero-beta-D-manno-heptose 1-phosphate adenylyltransferase [Deltaproteobacteria bacterium]|nr:D-glycero-beta-D-manno-heptose 1-phosphate adenylyltransferase [Deltaproteobacteria bacterium]
MNTKFNNSAVLVEIDKHRQAKHSIVFTNGCFDILHPGHVRYLSEAKLLGDILVVAINTDDSVRKLKGPERPVNNQEFRLEMLLALKPVDYVCTFEEETPIEIIKQVKPDVLVKGGDWTIENIVGHEFVGSYGGKTLSLPFSNGYSSTNIISKIKRIEFVKRFAFACLMLIGVAWASAAQAQWPQEVPPIVITPSGYDRPLSQTVGSVAVVNPESYTGQQQNISVGQLVERVPGVDKNSDSSWGSDINIRGLSRDSVIMLVDGYRVNTANDLNAQYGLIDPHDISRIEILKGSISALYGSGSIGGVVNVITKGANFSEQEKTYGEITADVGSNPEGFGIYTNAGASDNDSYVFASKSFRNFASYDNGHGQEIDTSQFTDYQSKFRFGEKWSESSKTEGQFQYYEGRDIGIPGSGTAPTPLKAELTYPEVSRLLLAVTQTITPTNSWADEHSLSLYWQDIRRRAELDNFPPLMPVDHILPGADHHTLGLKTSTRISDSENEYVWGLDVWQRELNSWRDRYLRSGVVLSEQPLPDARFLSSGLYMENNNTSFKDLLVNYGARGDGIFVRNDATAVWAEQSNDDFAWNYHLGSQYSLDENWKIKALTSHGYRAATIEERYAYLDLGNGIVKYGNPNLDSERSNMQEVTLEWSDMISTVGLTAYHNRLTDLITDTRQTPTTIVSENINKATIRGLELSLEHRLSTVQKIYGFLSYTQGKNTLSNDSLPDIAPFNGSLGSTYQLTDSWLVDLNTVFNSAQNNTPVNVLPSEEWITANVRIAHRFQLCANKGEISFNIYNIFDKNYSSYLSNSRGIVLDEPGRAFVLSSTLLF